RVRPCVRDLGDELRECVITVVDAVDDATGEEAIAEVADRTLDLALVPWLADGAELGLDAHRGAQREQGRVETNGGADALEDDDLGIVEQPLPRRAAERDGAADERATQRVDGQVDDEL